MGNIHSSPSCFPQSRITKEQNLSRRNICRRGRELLLSVWHNNESLKGLTHTIFPHISRLVFLGSLLCVTSSEYYPRGWVTLAGPSLVHCHIHIFYDMLRNMNIYSATVLSAGFPCLTDAMRKAGLKSERMTSCSSLQHVVRGTIYSFSLYGLHSLRSQGISQFDVFLFLLYSRRYV